MGMWFGFTVANGYTGCVGNQATRFPGDEARSHPARFKQVTEYLAHLPLLSHCG